MFGGPRLTLVVSALVLLSGCVDQPVEDDEPTQGIDAADHDPEAVHVLDRSDCMEQIGIYPVSQETVAPYIPEGYAPMPALPPELYPDADPTGQTASLLLIGFVCAEPEVMLFVAYLPVVPPEAVRLEGAYYHSVALPCVVDEASLSVLVDWQVPCEAGEVSIEPMLDTPGGARWALAVASDGYGLLIDGNAPASATPAGPELIRAFHASDGRVCSVLDVRVESHEHWQMGTAVLEVEGEAPFPVPAHPGLSSLGRSGFGLNVTHMPDVAQQAGAMDCV